MSSRIGIMSIILAFFAGNCAHGDLVTLFPMPPFNPTGATVNALAGPLFSSDIDSIDIPSSGSGTASAAKDGNFATHTYGVELDYSTMPGFFDSSYGAAGPFSRTATLDHRASAESIFFFAVDVPTIFDVTGFFGVTDDAGTTIAGNVELEIELLEFESFDTGAPPPDTVFYSYQVSKSTLDQVFAVGGMDGDTTNVLIGDPFGILDPGKFYRYRTLVTTNAIDIDGAGPMGAADGGASAVGEHTIVFTAAVPEPTSTVLLLLLGGMSLSLVRRRSLSP